MAKSSTTNPKGAGRKPLPETKIKTSLFIKPGLFKEVKVMAVMQDKTITDVVNEALEFHVSTWKKGK